LPREAFALGTPVDVLPQRLWHQFRDQVQVGVAWSLPIRVKMVLQLETVRVVLDLLEHVELTCPKPPILKNSFNRYYFTVTA